MSFNIHEYQSKAIFKKYGIPFNEGGVADSPEQAFEIAKRLSEAGYTFAVKAQVHAGGRGSDSRQKACDASNRPGRTAGPKGSN